VLEDRGSLDVGKRADLILVDGDPTSDISDIRRVALVINGDIVYYPAEIRPFTTPLWSGTPPR
jgi:imidazolonepropionase-like amidohydrolase